MTQPPSFTRRREDFTCLRCGTPVRERYFFTVGTPPGQVSRAPYIARRPSFSPPFHAQ